MDPIVDYVNKIIPSFIKPNQDIPEKKFPSYYSLKDTNKNEPIVSITEVLDYKNLDLIIKDTLGNEKEYERIQNTYSDTSALENLEVVSYYAKENDGTKNPKNNKYRVRLPFLNGSIQAANLDAITNYSRVIGGLSRPRTGGRYVYVLDKQDGFDTHIYFNFRRPDSTTIVITKEELSPNTSTLPMTILDPSRIIDTIGKIDVYYAEKIEYKKVPFDKNKIDYIKTELYHGYYFLKSAYYATQVLYKNKGINDTRSGGIFIIRVPCLFTELSMDILKLCSYWFEQIYIVKPISGFMYVVCRLPTAKIIPGIENILEQTKKVKTISSLFSNKDNKLISWLQKLNDTFLKKNYDLNIIDWDHCLLLWNCPQSLI